MYARYVRLGSKGARVSAWNRRLHRWVEVAEGEIRICGSPDRFLKPLANPMVSSATAEVRSFEPRWLLGQDSNLRQVG